MALGTSEAVYRACPGQGLPLDGLFYFPCQVLGTEPQTSALRGPPERCLEELGRPVGIFPALERWRLRRGPAPVSVTQLVRGQPELR